MKVERIRVPETKAQAERLRKSNEKELRNVLVQLMDANQIKYQQYREPLSGDSGEEEVDRVGKLYRYLINLELMEVPLIEDVRIAFRYISSNSWNLRLLVMREVYEQFNFVVPIEVTTCRQLEEHILKHLKEEELLL